MSPEDDLFQRLRVAEQVHPTAATEGTAAEKELLQGDPSAGTPVTLRNIFTHHDTHPVVLDFALLKEFGVEWLSWEPETVWQEVRRVFKSQISEHARAKIQAVKTLHVSLLPWSSWHVFEKITQALNNNIPRWNVMQAPTIEQLYVAVDIMQELREVPFEGEVRSYIAAAALHDEICFLPDPLSFAQAEASMPVLTCKDCGNVESFQNDHVCSSCSHRFAPDQGFSFDPKDHRVEKGKGLNTEVKLTYDPMPAKARWEELKAQPYEKAPLEETNADMQVGKLLIARDYMNVRRKQLAEQLTSLKSWLGSTG